MSEPNVWMGEMKDGCINESFCNKSIKQPNIIVVVINVGTIVMMNAYSGRRPNQKPKSLKQQTRDSVLTLLVAGFWLPILVAGGKGGGVLTTTL